MVDFVLVTNEIIHSASPHKCTILRGISTDRGDGAFVVSLVPALPPYADKPESSKVILAPKWVGTKLSPLSAPLAAVLVMAPNSWSGLPERITHGDYWILDWGLAFESDQVAYQWHQYWQPPAPTS